MLKYLIWKPKKPDEKFRFKARFSFKSRINEAENILHKNKDKVPVIIEKQHLSNLPKINNYKFLFPRNTTIEQIIMILKNKILNTIPQNIIIFIGNNIIPSPSDTIGELYDKYKDMDLFLYFKISA